MGSNPETGTFAEKGKIAQKTVVSGTLTDVDLRIRQVLQGKAYTAS